jgi:uncharacterized protein YdaU (DUF1376 family)
MTKNAWIRFFPSDWLGGTRGMSASETGVYITLVCLLYEHDNCLTNDTGRLARQCGLPASKFKSILTSLIEEEKIDLEDGILSNGKVAEELSHSHQKRTLAQQSANSRWKKKPKENKDPSKRTHSGRNANQNQNINNNFSDFFKDIRGDVRIESGSDEAAAWLDWLRANDRQCPNPLNGFFYFKTKLPPTSETA